MTSSCSIPGSVHPYDMNNKGGIAMKQRARCPKRELVGRCESIIRDINLGMSTPELAKKYERTIHTLLSSLWTHHYKTMPRGEAYYKRTKNKLRENNSQAKKSSAVETDHRTVMVETGSLLYLDLNSLEKMAVEGHATVYVPRFCLDEIRNMAMRGDFIRPQVKERAKEVHEALIGDSVLGSLLHTVEVRPDEELLAREISAGSKDRVRGIINSAIHLVMRLNSPVTVLTHSREVDAKLRMIIGKERLDKLLETKYVPEGTEEMPVLTPLRGSH